MEISSDDCFKLSEVDTAFTSRSRGVFASLDSIEAKHKAFEKNRSDDSSDLLKPDPAEEPVISKANFKSPKGIPWKCKLPDYKVRPDKWKMYDLSGVSVGQLSEQSNRRTALEFINSLKSRSSICDTDAANQKEEEEMDLGTDKDDKQHVFRKPATLKQAKLDENQSEKKGASQTIDTGSICLMAQPCEDREGEESDRDVEPGLGDTMQVNSTHMHFQSKGLHDRKKNIRPKTQHTDSDEEDQITLQDIGSRITSSSMEESDKNHESDESNEFSEDNAGVNSDSDEEHDRITDLEGSGCEFSVLNAKELQELKSDEQESSDDEDVCKRAAEFAFVESIHNSSFVLADQGKKCENRGDNLMDDLDNVD